jgi:PKD repeat protein/peroxiredoxin
MSSRTTYFRNHKVTTITLWTIILLGMMITQTLPPVNALTLAPDFTAIDTEGNSFSLTDFRGDLVLLEFMQTNSSECIEQVQYLKTLHSEYDEDLVLMSLSVNQNETMDDLRQFREIYSTTGIYALSTSDFYTEKYNVTSVPTIYLIDQEGFIQRQIEGVVEDTLLRPEIERLLTSTLMLTTTPRLKQIHFLIDEQDYYSDVNGTIHVDLRLGAHNITLLDIQFTRIGVEYQFRTWSGHISENTNPLLINISEPMKVITLQANFDSSDLLPPIADAGSDQLVSAGEIVFFDGSNSSDNVGITTYMWTFYDEVWQTLTGVQATHIFFKPGEYHVTLNITDAAGFWATDSLIVNIQDHTHPVAQAGEDQTIAEDTMIVFNGSASYDDVEIQSYVWSFWDGGSVTLSGVTANYTFHTPDSYQVTLTVADTSGNKDTDSVIITVVDITNPIANAGPDLVTLEDRVLILNGSSSWDENAIVSYSWTFIDQYPITLTGASVNYTFYHPGEYMITLLVTDIAGNTASDIAIIRVLDTTNPRANAGQNQVTYIGDLVTFDAGLSTDNGRIIKYTWIFGDGGEGTGNPSTHVYNVPSQYNVTLTVQDAANNVGIDHTTVIVLDRKTLVIDLRWIPFLLIFATMNLIIVKQLKNP